MRHQYVGDIGDFYKYGLLRALCQAESEHPLKLGVVWYLTTDEETNNDGNKLSYLNHPKRYEPCDPPLFQALTQLIIDQDRRVDAIAKRGILPHSTVYFEEPLSLRHLKGSQVRLTHRAQWHGRAKATVAGCDMVFVDPDMGLAVKSTQLYDPKGPKYLCFKELADYTTSHQTLVIYQHLHRKTVENHLAEGIEQLKANLSFSGSVLTVSVPHRLFFILPAPQHQELIKQRLAAIQVSPWQSYFKVFFN